ncbi:hypothetical protein GKQ38_03395 [Candidatus Nanohaloarchaea archaeon]|nr:hypothetical protein GKQ38_03395 [Candidatus Nanohaloarchaea archaeon]
MLTNEYAEEAGSKEKIVEEAIEYDSMWSDYDLQDRIFEDEDFVYLELEAEDDIADEFHDLGRELKARSSSVVDGGERYVLAVEK